MFTMKNIERVNAEYVRPTCDLPDCGWHGEDVAIRQVEGWSIAERNRDEHAATHRCFACGSPVKMSPAVGLCHVSVSYDGDHKVVMPVSESDARRVLALVIEQFRDEIGTETRGPTLQSPGMQCRGWAIVWEVDAPERWPMRVDRDKYPSGVFAEPINYLMLGLYPQY